MKTEDPSDRDSLVDLAAVKRIFLQLIDVHRFADWRIFLDSEDPDEPDFTSYDPENTPLWIIHREDLEAIGALHKQLVKAIGSAHIPMEDGEKSEGFLIIRKRNFFAKQTKPGASAPGSLKACSERTQMIHGSPGRVIVAVCFRSPLLNPQEYMLA